MTSCPIPWLYPGRSYLVTDTGIASTVITLGHGVKENELDASQLTGQNYESFRCPQLYMLLTKSHLFPLLIWILM